MPNPLAALFSPNRRLAAAEPRLLQKGALLGGTQWVVPRSECQYRRHDFSALPVRQRHAAAALHAKRYFPAANSLARIGWLDGIAHFWIWEKPVPAVTGSRYRWLPESVLRRPMLPNGLHLLKCENGVEGQAWRDGNLLASQWWGLVPDVGEWHRFMRGAGFAVDQAPVIPSVQQLPLLPYPWTQMQPMHSGQLAKTEFLIWVSTLCVIAAAAGWQASSLQEWERLRVAQQAQLIAMRAQSGPILDARERAEAAVAGLQDLNVVLQDISDYDLIADVVKPLPAKTRLLSYTRETGKLQVLVSLPDDPKQPAGGLTSSIQNQVAIPSAQLPTIDLRKIVALYQNHHVLSEASATPVPGGLSLEFVLPKAEEDEYASDATSSRSSS